MLGMVDGGDGSEAGVLGMGMGMVLFHVKQHVHG